MERRTLAFPSTHTHASGVVPPFMLTIALLVVRPVQVYPTVITPDLKLSREDIFAVHRTYYEGTCVLAFTATAYSERVAFE